MKKQRYIFFYLWILTVACQQKNAEAPTLDETVPEQQTATVTLPKIMQLNPDYEAVLNQWDAYKALEIEMQNFQETASNAYNNNIEELLKLEKALSKSDFPENLDVPSVKSRILVFKTYVLQAKTMFTEAAIHVNAVDQQRKIIIAFNALKKQFAEVLSDDITEELLKKIEE